MRMAYLGLVSLALLGAPDFAEAASGPQRSDRAVVSVRGLDLSADAGIGTARARVRRAAEHVCGDHPRVGPLPPPGVARCRAAAVRAADARSAALAARASDDRIAMARMGRHHR